jgi:hypothetical protein
MDWKITMNDPYKDLNQEIDIGHHAREEAREEAREWAKTLIFVALGGASLLAILWLGGAF